MHVFLMVLGSCTLIVAATVGVGFIYGVLNKQDDSTEEEGS